MKIRKIHIISFLLFITYTYPTSPIIHQVFIINPQIAYVLFIFAALTLASSIRVKVVESRIGKIDFKYYLHWFLLVSLVISLIKTNNFNITRDLLSLIVLIYIWRNLNYREISGIIISQIYIASFLLMISIISTVVFLYFNSPEQTDWVVTELALHNKNPAISRHEYGDFDYRLPFYLSVVPMLLQENHTLRLPLLFIEPTFLAYYVLPLFFITVFDKSIKYRTFILTIFISSLLFAKSVLGFILLVFVPMSYFFIYLASTINIKGLHYLVIVIGVVVIINNFQMLIIDIIKYFNYNSFVSFLEMLRTLSLIKLTPFGFNMDTSAVVKFPANTVLIQRYGYVGMLFYIFIMIGLVISALKISIKLPMSFYRKVLAFSSIVVPTLFALKVPFIVLPMPIFLAIYLSYEIEKRCEVDAK